MQVVQDQDQVQVQGPRDGVPWLASTQTRPRNESRPPWPHSFSPRLFSPRRSGSQVASPSTPAASRPQRPAISQ